MKSFSLALTVLLCALALPACSPAPETTADTQQTPEPRVQADEPEFELTPRLDQIKDAPGTVSVERIRTKPPASKLVMRGKYQVDTGRDCDGYPRMNLTTPDGLCVGLVADRSTPVLDGRAGLKFPRDILFPNEEHTLNGEALITDMGGWAENKGRLMVLNDGQLEVAIRDLNLPHEIDYGPDGEMYVAEAHKILRIHSPPMKDDGYAWELFIDNLPFKNGAKLNLHPLKAFAFTDENTIWVNSGSQSDRCLGSAPKGRCEDAKDTAVVMKFTKGTGGKWVENPDDRARGLRNSMGLAAHRSGLVLQANNGSDFEDADKPNEEINVIRAGAHYGWPYCYDVAETDPAWTSAPMQCSIMNPSYFTPEKLLPPHGAPLDLLYAPAGTLGFSDETLIVPLHGYRAAGHRILMFDVDAQGVPVGEAKDLVTGWHADATRPRGAPVGLTVAPDGSLWGVEDKNKTVFRIAQDGYESAKWGKSVAIQAANAPIEYAALQAEIFKPNCMSCHTEFSGTPNASFAAITASGWLDPVDGIISLTHRLTASGREQMPPGNRLHEDDIARVEAWIESLTP